MQLRFLQRVAFIVVLVLVDVDETVVLVVEIKTVLTKNVEKLPHSHWLGEITCVVILLLQSVQLQLTVVFEFVLFEHVHYWLTGTDV